MKQTFLNSDRFQDKRKEGNLKSSYIQDRNKDSNLKSVIEVVLEIIGSFWNRTIGVSPSAHKYFNLIRKWNILKIEHEEKSTLKKIYKDSCTMASQQLWWLKNKTR